MKKVTPSEFAMSVINDLVCLVILQSLRIENDMLKENRKMDIAT